MIRKHDLTPAVARAFVKDMKAFFAEENRYNRNKGTGGLQWNTR
jgi:lipase chaperone LimK